MTSNRLFASTDLAARIERAECRLLTDSAASVARRRPDADVFVVEGAGGVAVYTIPDSPLNKFAGLGFAGPLDEEQLQEIERTFDQRSTPLQVELSSLGEGSIGALLTRRGYVLRGFENELGRGLPPDVESDVRPGIEVSVMAVEDLATWVDIAVTGFETPDTQGVPSHESYPREAIEQTVLDFAEADGVVMYLAKLEGNVAGAASMRMFEGVAHLCGAATLPACRRRGVHNALLETRLRDAAEAGCDVAVVTTQPGSKSHENVQRKGFDLLYTRAVLRRE